MVTAIGMLKVDVVKIKEVIDFLLEIPQVTSVFSVSGPFDILVHISASNNDGLYELITERFATQTGIKETETLLVFKGYNSKDMERLFSIGLDAGE